MSEKMRRAFRLIYPMRCPGCDEILRVSDRERGFCRWCYRELTEIEGVLCLKCGKKLLDQTMEYCKDCANIEHSFDQNRALFLYAGPIVEGMYRFKYSNRRDYAEIFSEYMIKKLGCFIEEISRDGELDAIIPIPMNEKSVRERGYNQAEALGDYLSGKIGVPCMKNIVLREKSTKKMKTLDPVERRLNLIRAFKYRETSVKLKKILLVDDIYTTGATMDSVSRVLREHGVKEIYSICVCIGSDRE